MRDATRLERTSQVVRGERSELRLVDGTITLTKDATTQARPTTVTVGIDRVRNVALERPSRGRRGWLHLGVVDGSPAPPSELAAASDPYTLPLTARHLPAARRLARMINDHIQRRGLPHDGETGTGPGVSSGVIVSSGPKAGEPVATSVAPSAPPPPPAPPAPGPGDDPATPTSGDELIERLRGLADLHREGALSDEEFQQAKQRILGEGPAPR